MSLDPFATVGTRGTYREEYRWIITEEDAKDKTDTTFRVHWVERYPAPGVPRRIMQISRTLAVSEQCYFPIVHKGDADWFEVVGM